MDKKTKKKIKKPTLSLVYAGSPYRVSTKCGGCHPKELIVASSHKIKHIIIITILTLICKSLFSVLLEKNKNQLKLLFSPPVPPNFWN